MSGRPLDVLEAAVGDDVVVRLKSGETYRGTLAGYDQHMNLVLDDAVASNDAEPGAAGNDEPGGSEDDEPGGTGDAGSGTAGDDAAPGDEEKAPDTGDEAPVDGRDTTIIRGDNVVSITP